MSSSHPTSEVVRADCEQISGTILVPISQMITGIRLGGSPARNGS